MGRATGYTATAPHSMDPANGPVVEVDESAATFTEYIYQPQPDQCLAANKPLYCYLTVSKQRKFPNAEDNTCTSSAAGGTVNPCPFTISLNINPTYVPAGSTVTIADDFTVGSTAVSGWAATVAPSFCPANTPTSVSFSCAHGSLSSFSGDVTVMIPPGQTGQKKNCITVTIGPPVNQSANACVTF